MQISNHDHIIGKKEAPVELLEYGDYQCPYCRNAYYIIKEIQKEMGDDMRFIFRNFPITSIHPHSFHAALAAEAAAEQGKFWEMHDMLYENQDQLEDAHLVEYAKKIDLDIARFEEDFSKSSHYDKIREDYNSGLQYGVQGTPAFFVNGEIFQGNWMSPEFLSYLKSMVR